MKAERDYEEFANTVNSHTSNLSFPNMDRCMSIGIMGGCGLRCAAFCDGECEEPYEFDVKDVREEFQDTAELQHILEFYPEFNKRKGK